MEGLETLARHAFTSPSQTTCLNAARCLANAMFLRPETRQMVVDQGYMAEACAKLKIDNRDIEFVFSRVLFLASFALEHDVHKLIQDAKLAEIMCVNIGRHAKRYSLYKPGKPKDQMADMALAETLKLLHIVLNYCPESIEKFFPALQDVLLVLSKAPISSSSPLEVPVGSAVNALISLDFESKSNVDTLFPKDMPDTYTDCFIDILEKATKVYKGSELEVDVMPLVNVLSKTYEVAPSAIKAQMRRVILPSTEDREQPLGRAETLPSRLLRQSIDPATPQIGNAISGLLFEMSDKDAQKFVQNIGYGFASGFLFQHGVPVPPNAMETFSNGGEASASKTQASKRAINPITGQFLDREKVVEVNMTDDEKMREAEKLFVLFERLVVCGSCSGMT
jgi:hypothetical protein